MKKMTNISENLPTMLYLHSNSDRVMDSVGAGLQEHFAGRYRFVSLDCLDVETDRSIAMVNVIIAKDRPQIIVGVGVYGDLAMLSDWDEDVDVIVVNPSVNKRLDEIPMWKFGNIFALCSEQEKYPGESYIFTLRSYTGLHLIETNAYSDQLNKAGVKQLISLIEKVEHYRKLGNSLMSYQEFEKMVRNRPAPDKPSYYRLKVYSYDTQDGYAREIVNDIPTYRRAVSCRQAQFATKDEALAAMRDIIASAKEDLCIFELDRLPFGVFDSKPFWLEAWSYDSCGNLIQELSCSGAHYHKGGIYGKFFGHLPENIKWHKGDIVQLFHHYFGDPKTYVCLGVVAEAPKDTHEGYEKYLYAMKQWIKEGNNPNDWLEMTGYEGSDDDEMFTQFGPYNDDWSNFTFNNPMSVLPAPENLPEEIKAELRSWHAAWLRHLEEERAEEIRVINQMCEYEKKKN